MDREMLFDIIYALAARDGREQALFGPSVPLAREAFSRSLPTDAFPELWFELPLAGAPWFDLHALASRTDFAPGSQPAPGICGGYPEVFSWFAGEERGVRQLALSWDVGTGALAGPAVQLLVKTGDVQVTCDFLAAAGRADAAPGYRSFVKRMPLGWFACYAGVFPQRPGHNLRVECIPSCSLQRAYAENPPLLEEHLAQVGVRSFGDTLLPRCQILADSPFQLEFQFDVSPEGTAGDTFGASVRFAATAEDGDVPFEPDGAAGGLMRDIEQWGLADDRWHLLAKTAFAQRASFAGQSVVISCYPAFVKLRWRDGEPVDAKAYLIAEAKLPL